MRAGTYRARFSGDDVVTFEREVVIAANRNVDVDVTPVFRKRLLDAPSAEQMYQVIVDEDAKY